MHRFSLSLQFPKFISQTFRQLSTHPTHLDDVGPMASLLTTRAVVRLRGPDTVKFLQGLLTNDVRKFGESLGEKKASTVPTPNLPALSTPPLYAALLTPQGRFLYDLFIHEPARPDQKLDEFGSGSGSDQGEVELYADVDVSVLDELLETFKKSSVPKEGKEGIESFGNKGVIKQGEPHICRVCGGRFYTNDNLVKHFKKIHKREQTKRLNRYIESARGKMRVKLVAKLSVKMEKYKNAVAMFEDCC